ncbi:MAG: hypothetical protein NXH88_19415 [Hyphomonas sp.]|nr:hypothetical protein [Hyphomonas sp.]
MKAIALSLGLCCLLAGCALGQDMYDDRRIDECRELPTPNERLDCERAARDEASGFPGG